MNRKKAEKTILSFLNKISPNNKATKAYKEKFKNMSDSEFKKFMEELRDGKRKLVLMQPPMSDNRISIENNIKVAEELGFDFHQRLWIGPTDTEPRHLTPIKYLVMDLPVRRTAQLLVKKISAPSTINVVDKLSGQVTGKSKGAAISYPELLVLAGMGLDKSIEELIKFRGGDQGGLRGFLAMADKFGTIRQDSIQMFSTEVASKKTVRDMLIAAYIRNNL